MSQVGKEMGLSRWNWEASEIHFTARKQGGYSHHNHYHGIKEGDRISS